MLTYVLRAPLIVHDVTGAEISDGDLLYNFYKEQYRVVRFDPHHNEWYAFQRPGDRGEEGDGISYRYDLKEWARNSVVVPIKNGKIHSHWKRPTMSMFETVVPKDRWGYVQMPHLKLRTGVKL